LTLTAPGIACPLCTLELPGLMRCPDGRAYYPAHNRADDNDCDACGQLVVEENPAGERETLEAIATDEFVQGWLNETRARSDADAHAIGVLGRLVQFLQDDRMKLLAENKALDARIEADLG
jgi:hypothetical protein